MSIITMHLALYEPDIPQNAGSLIRLGACLGVGVEIIEPCGFVLGERAFRRAGLDYLDRAVMRRHGSWREFLDWREAGENARLVLLTTKGETDYTGFAFETGKRFKG